MFRRFKALGAMLSLAIASTMATAAPPHYPSKPIRLVVPFSAGSATDILARIISTKMGEGGTYQIVVDNRPGAGGTLGATTVARSAPALMPSWLIAKS